MKTKWILQTNIFKEKAVDKLITCLDRQKIKYDLIKIIPFSNELPKGITNYDGPVLAYGTTTLLKNISKSKKFYPGMWYNENTFKPSTWGKIFNTDWLNSDSKIVKFKDVLKHYDKSPLFIRPNDDLKLFSGEVFDKYEFEMFTDSVVYNELFDINIEVAICKQKDISSEWRFIIIDNEVVTCSKYRHMNRLYISNNINDITDEAINLAEKIARHKWQVDSAYVVDICRTYQGEYKIIEFNCLNASGLYDCDIMAFIYKANKLAEKQFYNR